MHTIVVIGRKRSSGGKLDGIATLEMGLATTSIGESIYTYSFSP